MPLPVKGTESVRRPGYVVFRELENRPDLCGLCARGPALAAQPVQLPISRATAELAAAQTSCSRTRSARRFLLAARGRCRRGTARTPEFDYRQCSQRVA